MVRLYATLLVLAGFFALALNSLSMPETDPAVPMERATAATPVREVERAELVKHSPPSRAQREANLALIVPVSGIARTDLDDTWGDARSEGRSHQGIDIMAPRGAQVVAAVDGRIVKFFDSVRGGVTIYQFDARGRYVYYYAHLQSRAVGLAEGDIVRQGDVIGYVGSSGNAPVPHLHFEIQLLGSERQWWRATSINPYPFLLAGRTPV